MIARIKLGIRLFPYAPMYKSSMVFIIIFGAGSLCYAVAGTWPLAVMFGYAAQLFLVQLLYSFSCAGLVQSSPHKKKLQCLIPMEITFCHQTVLYLLMSGVYVFGGGRKWEQQTSCFLLAGTATVAITLYNTLVLRYPWVSALMFFLVLAGMNDRVLSVLLEKVFVKNVMPVDFLLGYAVLAAGVVLGYAVSCLMYRKGFSETTVNNWIRSGFR